MTKHLKRFAVVLITLAGILILIGQIRKLFDYPYLYLDLSGAHLSNVIFLGLALLLFALAMVAAVYLFFNVDGRIVELVVPLVCLLVLGLGSFFCAKGAVKGIPCTYTTSLAAYGEDFSPEEFQSADLSLYPKKQRGLVSGYAYYENGDTRVRRVTALFEAKRYYMKEVKRLEGLDLDAFTDENRTCYTLRSGTVVWQVVADADTQEITYTRFDNPEQLPGFLPGILTEPAPDSSDPASTGEAETTGNTDSETEQPDTDASESTDETEEA